MLPRPRELRAYQRELLEHTRREHVVAALPTGAGKTLVAFALAAELLRTQRDEFKAVFLAPTVPLVVQQQRVFATEAEREGLVMRTAPFFGMPDPTDRRLLLAGLQSGKLPLYLFRVVREISELIGSDEKAAITDQATEFYDPKWWASQLEGNEMLFMTPQVLLNCLTHNLIPAERLSLLVLDEAHHAALGDSHPYRGVLQQLQTCGPLPRLKRLGLTASPAPGIALYSCNEALLQRELDRLEERTGCVVLGPSDPEAIARCVHEPREIEVVCGPGDSASLGEWAAFAEMHLVKRYEERGLPKSNNKLVALVAKMLRRQPHLQQMMTLREHALVHELQARAARAEASDFRGLVYCKEQRHCLMLAGLLRAVRGLEAFRPAMFVGHGEVAKARGDVLRARLGMSVALQVRAMNEFAAGESKLLVCTSVLEEGIDVPTCSLVIRFHALQDVTSYIQSRGRARARDGEYLALSGEEGHLQRLCEQRLFIASYLARKCAALRPAPPMEAPPADLLIRVPGDARPRLVRNAELDAVVNRYVASLALDALAPRSPQCIPDKESGVLRLALPLNAPPDLRLVEFMCADPESERARLAAMRVLLQRLCDAGELDANLLPTGTSRIEAMAALIGVAPEALSPVPARAEGAPQPPADAPVHSLLGAEDQAAWRSVTWRLRAADQDGEARPAPWCVLFRGLRGDALEVDALLLDEPKSGRMWRAALRVAAEPTIVTAEQEALGTRLRSRLYSLVWGWHHAPQNSHVLFVPLDAHGALDWAAVATMCSGPEEGIRGARGEVCVATTHSHPAHWYEVVRDTPAESVDGPFPGGAFATYRDYFLFRYGMALEDAEGAMALPARRVRVPGPFWLAVRRRTRLARSQPASEEAQAAEAEREKRLNTVAQVPRSLLKCAWPRTLLDACVPLPTIAALAAAHLNARDALLACGPLARVLPPRSELARALAGRASALGLRHDNDRFEFLGDSFFKLCTSVLLARAHRDADSGTLTWLRSALVSNANLAAVLRARHPALLPFIIRSPIATKLWDVPLLQPRRLGDALPRSALAEKATADVVEALLGATLCARGPAAACRLAAELGVLPAELLARARMAPEEAVWVAQDAPERAARQVCDWDLLAPLPDGLQALAGEIEARVGYRFADKALLLQALTHASAVGLDVARWGGCYDRLEFLGDAVLELCVTRRAVSRHEDWRVGDLTRLRIALVNNERLARLALELRLDAAAVILSPKLAAPLERARRRLQLARLVEEKILADLFEALLGAVFVDAGGDLGVSECVVQHLLEREWAEAEEADAMNPVAQLYELVSKLEPRQCIRCEYSRSMGEVAEAVTAAASRLERTMHERMGRLRVLLSRDGVERELLDEKDDEDVDDEALDLEEKGQGLWKFANSDSDGESDSASDSESEGERVEGLGSAQFVCQLELVPVGSGDIGPEGSVRVGLGVGSSKKVAKLRAAVQSREVVQRILELQARNRPAAP